ncbi:E3 ubiquitin-protein ligase DZIP3-like isoform X2 [Mytilus californianus]|uniref:E3 ubiquitin-protein ligase DZIP3-like isoform X2 n=1 Tax=Mytilus californianus TaxID=6549 RepID=UPI00224586C7|nr:E3 ubiquitin-protein ligase DZIP3-like isoform X2 [Mytilus californianus]XP_052073022.1 E3 ubiquitin-protein ligase DZIP3-like isoform X2 [Mytilus californianus]
MAPITIEEEHFLRIVQLIFGVVVEAVRTIFDKFFPPLTLRHTLQAKRKDMQDLQKKQILRKSQMDVLFPSTGFPSSNNFDITLMVCLLQNLKQVQPHSLKTNVMPPSSDKSEGADLVRLRFHRNTIGHIERNTINTHIFTTMWADITQAVLRLGGSKYQQKCDDIRNMTFDTTIISNIQQEVQGLKSMLIDELSDINQRVLNIEQQMDSQTTSDIHKVMIEKWEYDNKTFVHTNAIKHIMSLIENEQCILIKGNPGSGRSFTIRHIALKLRDRQCKHEYEIVLCRESKDIETNYKAQAYQVFVCDDICGEYTIDR